MDCEIISDTLDLEMESLDAILPDPSQPMTIGPGYPFPMLRRSGQVRQMTLRTVTLRNQFVEAVFCPDLGGRILSLRDMKNGTEALPRGLTLVDDPVRGVTAQGGLELTLDGTRPGAMASVDSITHEGETVELTMFEIVQGRDISWMICAELSPDSIGLGLKLALQNRGRSRCQVDLGWRWDGDRIGMVEGNTLSILQPPALGLRSLEPHQVVTTEVAMVPLSFAPLAINRNGALGLEGSRGFAQLFHESTETKLVVQTERGTLEASVALEPNKVEIIDLSSISEEISGMAILSQGKVIVQWPTPTPKRVEEEAGTRHFVHWQRAVEAIQANDHASADAHLEASLLYNGDDPLAWWLKAAVQRNMGVDGERPELLNAHFLCPLEPILRVEGFLSQQEHTKDASPLIAPLARDPDALTDAVCMLIDCNLFEDATRIIDEALRHSEHKMLRYLMASLHLAHTGMDFEAVTHIKAAEALPLGPPYPWRHAEREALRVLHGRFPDMAGIAMLLDLANRAPHQD